MAEGTATEGPMKSFRIASSVLAALLTLAIAGAAATHPGEPETKPQVTYDRANTARAAIESAYRDGGIGFEEMILLKARSLYEPDSLPEAYRGEGADKCGTATAIEIEEALPRLRAEVAAEIRGMRARPVCHTFHETTHFRIHYDTSGDHMILGHPGTAYRDSIAAALERCWAEELAIGFRQPPNDGGDPDGGGGNGLYDVYIQNLAPGYLGYCQGSYTVPATPRTDCTSYVVIDNDYAGYGDAYDLMKVTVAHEFCHACQFSSNYEVDAWYMECTSVWIEDVIYDDVDDYRDYLPFYFNYPYASLDWNDGTGLRMYGSCVWDFFLTEWVDPLAVPEVWSALESGSDVYARTDAALAGHGTSLEDAFRTYCVWNWFTASRDDGAHYEEGAHWPLVTYEITYSSYPVIDGGPTLARRPDHMGWNYIRLSNPGGADDVLDVTYDGPWQSDTKNYACINTIGTGGSKLEYGEIFLDQYGNGSIPVTDWDLLSVVAVVVVNASTIHNDMYYAIDVDRSSPVAGSFTAADAGASVTLRWTLADPAGVVALDVFRAAEPAGPYGLLNTEPLAVTSPGTYVDTDVLPGDELWYELRATLLDGTEDVVGAGPVFARIEGALGLTLAPPRPNPFRESASVDFTIPSGAGPARVAIYDARGRLVKTLADGAIGRGRHVVSWDATDESGARAAAGVYFCSLEVPGAVLARKVTLLR
jgi:hypothetical protein